MNITSLRRLRGPSPVRSFHQQGVAAVELAVLLTPLVLMIFGATELGRAIYTFNVLDKTVRDAARHLSQNRPGDTAIAAEATCLTVYGTTDCSGTSVASGLTKSMVTICDATVTTCSNYANQPTGYGSSSINLVSVTIAGYPFTSLVKFVIPNLTFNPISVTMRGQQ